MLSTDFNNTGAVGTDMNGVTWTENGLLAPTTLTGSGSLVANDPGTVDAAGGFFSVNTNVNGSSEGSPAWSLTFTITVGGSNIDLTDIVLASVEANATATLGAGNGTSFINLDILDNTSTLSVFNNTLNRSNGSEVQNLTYTTPVTLTASNTYDVTFTVWENVSSGHYEGFDSLTFNAVPEPSAALFVLTGLGFFLLRRRRN